MTIIRCDHCNTPIMEVKGREIRIVAKHHGVQHISVVRIEELSDWEDASVYVSGTREEIADAHRQRRIEGLEYRLGMCRDIIASGLNPGVRNVHQKLRDLEIELAQEMV